MNDGRTTIAIPSTRPGGLEAQRSGHFGRCDCFTLVDVQDGEVQDVRIIDNPPHVEGGCLAPVQLLSSHGVDALVVAGIGGRPLAGFRQAGIEVYHDTQMPVVGAVVQALLDGGVDAIQDSSVCGGH